MKHSTISLARRRAWAAAVTADFSAFDDRQLIEEASRLHRDLAASDHGFSWQGGSGLRHVLVRQLLAIDEEHRRRTERAAA